jgi:hypothetical protein
MKKLYGFRTQLTLSCGAIVFAIRCSPFTGRPTCEDIPRKLQTSTRLIANDGYVEILIMTRGFCQLSFLVFECLKIRKSH